MYFFPAKYDYFSDNTEIFKLVKNDNCERLVELEGNAINSKRFNSDEIKQFDPIFSNAPMVAHVAAFFGSLNILEYIFHTGGKLDVVDDHKRYPVHFAAAGGKLGIIKFLVDLKSSITVVDNDSKSIAHYACEYGQLNILKYAANCNVNLMLPSRIGAPIHIACTIGNFPIIEYLASKAPDYVDVNAMFNSNRTPLSILLRNSFFEAIPLLLTPGKLDIDQKTNIGWSVLPSAIRSKNMTIIDVVIKYGANVNIKDPLGWTPMHIASQELMAATVRKLVDNGAQAQVKTTMGITPFMLAKNKYSPEKVNTLNEIVRGVKIQLAMSFIRKILEE